MPTERVAVRGSERKMPLDSTVIGVADPNEEVNVTVVIRRRTHELPPPASTPIPRDQFAGLYGADPADVEQINGQLRRDRALSLDRRRSPARRLSPPNQLHNRPPTNRLNKRPGWRRSCR